MSGNPPPSPPPPYSAVDNGYPVKGAAPYPETDAGPQPVQSAPVYSAPPPSMNADINHTRVIQLPPIVIQVFHIFSYIKTFIFVHVHIWKNSYFLCVLHIHQYSICLGRFYTWRTEFHRYLFQTPLYGPFPVETDCRYCNVSCIS